MFQVRKTIMQNAGGIGLNAELIYLVTTTANAILANKLHTALEEKRRGKRSSEEARLSLQER